MQGGRRRSRGGGGEGGGGGGGACNWSHRLGWVDERMQKKRRINTNKERDAEEAYGLKQTVYVAAFSCRSMKRIIWDGLFLLVNLFLC